MALSFVLSFATLTSGAVRTALQYNTVLVIRFTVLACSHYLNVSKQTVRITAESPTKSLFDVGSRRIYIVTVNTKEYHSDVLAIITRIMHFMPFDDIEAHNHHVSAIPGAITLSLFTTVDSQEEGAKFEVTDFYKAFDSSTLGKAVDLGRWSFSIQFGF
ncbi:hypothetical protein Tco_0484163 [Tanacetum coccineum]